MKKIILIIGSLLLLVFLGLAFYYFRGNVAPEDQNAVVDEKKTKKWHPGNYIWFAYSSPEAIENWFHDNDNPDYIKGARVRIGWKTFEEFEGQYTVENLQPYLDALPEGKHLIVSFDERDMRGKGLADQAPPGIDCKEIGQEDDFNIPNYILNHPDYPAIGTTHKGGPPEGCIAQYWEAPIRDRMVAVVKEIAKVYDNNPKFEGIMFGETSFGIPQNYIGRQFSTVEKIALMDFHTRISSSFQRSHVIQNMNHLDGGDGDFPKCDQLRELADHLTTLGHAMGNPDSVPWESMPWDCNHLDDFGSYDYPGLLPGDKPKPNYVVFRENTPKIPLFSGNDTSQLECPTNPRTFNNEEMDYDGLAKYHYQTGVTGYRYRPNASTDIVIPPLGTNYLFWADGFINSTTTAAGCPDPEEGHKELYTEAYKALLSQPGYTTNLNCPSSINCEGTVPNTPTPTSIEGATLTPTPIQSVTPTPTTIPGSSPTPTVQPSATPTLITGNICDKADSDHDGNFDIADFVSFAAAYRDGKRTCDDKDVDYGECGGRDVNRDGTFNIIDFISFASRYYPKLSCALP